MKKNIKRVLTFSAISTFRACERRYKYQYVDGYEKIKTGESATGFGTLIHDILELHYRESGAVAAQHIEELIEENKDKDHAFTLRKARALYFGYVSKYGSRDFEVVDLDGSPAVELEGSVGIVNPETNRTSRTFVIGFKLDMVVKNVKSGVHGKAGRRLLLDHKTTGLEVRGDSDFWHKLLNSSQVPIYIFGAKGLSLDIDGFLFNAIYKPQQRPLKATPEDKRQYKKDGSLYANQRDTDETPDEYESRLTMLIAEDPDRYFGRREATVLNTELIGRMKDVSLYALKIRHSENNNLWPKNEAQCHNYIGFGQCDFFNVCWKLADLHDETLFRKKKKINEELGQSDEVPI